MACQARSGAASLMLASLVFTGGRAPAPDPVGGSNRGMPTRGTFAGVTSGGNGKRNRWNRGPLTALQALGLRRIGRAARLQLAEGRGVTAAPADPPRVQQRRRHLLGDTTRPADQFVPESAQSGFTNGADSTPAEPGRGRRLRARRDGAGQGRHGGGQASRTLVGCDPNATAGQDACATNFIRSFGARAFRRTAR